MRNLFLTILLSGATLGTPLFAENIRPEISVAGFINFDESGRQVYNFNPGWRFYRGAQIGAEAINFDDSRWDVVATPHAVELTPAEASGCRNYQGEAWYRKRFVVPSTMKGKHAQIYFEAAMGKQKIYVNGKFVKENIGGYLPFYVDLHALGIQAGDNCVIAVMTDNSDDRDFPPGKRQYTLDFSYHGGIYRDVWMIGKSPVAITDANQADKIAGGGVFVHYNKISDKSADVHVDTDVKNSDKIAKSITLETSICDATGKVIKTKQQRITLQSGESRAIRSSFTVSNPKLWEPDSPYLYRVKSSLKEGSKQIDGGITRVGIRLAEFRGTDGFWLNGKPFGQLVGANRHQDFAYVGNAMPNSQQWRDAKKLRDAGCRIIRAAHYPQDPAFMDACDELGMFVIVATPGWQFWNKDPRFGELANENNRQMIRRDRNHPSVLLWEPILNETRFPLEFAMSALQITKDEFPHPGAPLAGADMHSEGAIEHYGVVYGWPKDDATGEATQSLFTREFGENVDDWYAHNNNNRASRSWGEKPLLVQAHSLAQSYDELYKTTGQLIGGALWHPFDHQRGYHPDPYWGGIFDCFRQPKYAYHMFRSQTAPDLNHPIAESGPMVFIAHEMSAFSESSVTVFSNCDSVRLTIFGEKTWVKAVEHPADGMPNRPVVFENVWDFWEAREYSYFQKNWQKVHMLAEGIINGEVVCSTQKMPARRSTKLRLSIDHSKQRLVADGSDFVVVIAEVTDDNGNVRRLAKENIVFSIEGEGEIIGDGTNYANPRPVEFGSAPVLIRSTLKSGKIQVTARVQFEGTHAATAAELEFESIEALFPACYLEERKGSVSTQNSLNRSTAIQLDENEKQRLLEEVERQQTEFGVQ